MSEIPSDALGLVVAMSLNGMIGRDGQLPWHLPEDLRHFRRLTTGHAIIMGRRTYESIGRPLPKRRNIVLSSKPSLEIDGCEVVASLSEAIALAREEDPEPMVIGGASVYAEALPLATKIYLTEVLREVEGDTQFPAFDRSQWRELSREEHSGARFLTLERATTV